MTIQEAIKIIKNEYCSRCDAKFICNGCYIGKAIEALEKQIPKKPIANECPMCEELIPRWDSKYCPCCGQKLDWSEE